MSELFPIEYAPFAYFIMAITIFISWKAFSNNELKARLLFFPARFKEQKDWKPLLGHSLIHANWMHLIFNMYVFYWFGTAVEAELVLSKGRFFGEILFLTLYIGGVIFASLPALLKHGNNPGYASLGASGAVSAVLLAFIIINPTAKLSFLFIPVPIQAWIMGIIFFVAEYFLQKRGGTGIAHDAHMGGAAFGLVFMALIDYHYIIDFGKAIGGVFGP
jgi:membrane associated rhomboid family serine protease